MKLARTQADRTPEQVNDKVDEEVMRWFQQDMDDALIKLQNLTKIEGARLAKEELALKPPADEEFDSEEEKDLHEIAMAQVSEPQAPGAEFGFIDVQPPVEKSDELDFKEWRNVDSSMIPKEIPLPPRKNVDAPADDDDDFADIELVKTLEEMSSSEEEDDSIIKALQPSEVVDVAQPET